MPTGPDSPDNRPALNHEDTPCFFCFGSGWVPNESEPPTDAAPCQQCGGSGVLAVWKVQ